MTPGEVVTYIVLALFGTGGVVAGIWAVLKTIIPKIVETKLEQEKQKLQAEIESNKDDREYKQKMQHLEHAYLQAESSVAQQRIAGMLEDANTFIQKTVADGINEIIVYADKIPDLSKKVASLEYAIVELHSHQKLLFNLLEKAYEDYKRLEKPTDDQA